MTLKQTASLALLTAALVAAAPAGATAKAPALILENGGTPLKQDARVKLEVGLLFDETSLCYLHQETGELKTNLKPTDKVTFAKAGSVVCEGGEQLLKGFVRHAALTSVGTLSLIAKPVLAITKPGQCTYDASELTGTFLVPGRLEDVLVSAPATLDAKDSAPTCAATTTIQGDASFRGTSGPLENES